MTNILELNPYPDIVADNSTRILSIFGGVELKNVQQPDYIGNSTPNYSTTDVLESIQETIDSISPIVDDAYRLDLSSYLITSKFKIVASMAPLHTILRNDPQSKSDWQFDEQALNDFQALEGITLKGYVEGRHTSFGIKPLKKQMLFLHILDKDARNIPNFIGQLELKLLEFLGAVGKIHYFSQQDNMLLTTIMENQDIAPGKNDSMIYF